MTHQACRCAAPGFRQAEVIGPATVSQWKQTWHSHWLVFPHDEWVVPAREESKLPSVHRSWQGQDASDLAPGGSAARQVQEIPPPTCTLGLHGAAHHSCQSLLPVVGLHVFHAFCKASSKLGCGTLPRDAGSKCIPLCSGTCTPMASVLLGEGTGQRAGVAPGTFLPVRKKSRICFVTAVMGVSWIGWLVMDRFLGSQS